MNKRGKYTHTNAREATYNGTKYPSKQEAEFARMLDGVGVAWERQHVFTLQPSFKDGAGTCRAITYTSDFNIGGVHVDVKGRMFADTAMRIKILRFLTHGQAGRINESGSSGISLWIAVKTGKKWALWLWDVPRANSKRKPLSFSEWVEQIQPLVE